MFQVSFYNSQTTFRWIPIFLCYGKWGVCNFYHNFDFPIQIQEQSFTLQKCERLFLMPWFHFLSTVGSIYIRDISGDAAVTSCTPTMLKITALVLELFPIAGLQIHISAEINSGQKTLRCSFFTLVQDVCELLLEKLSAMVYLAIQRWWAAKCCVLNSSRGTVFQLPHFYALFAKGRQVIPIHLYST